jgi:hypothetical protein
VVTAHAHVHAGTVFGTALTDQDVAGDRRFTAKEFDAQAFRLGMCAMLV